MRVRRSAERPHLGRHQAERPHDVGDDLGVPVEVGLGSGGILRGDHRDPCALGLRPGRAVPGRFPRQRLGQREGLDPERARKVVETRDDGRHADHLHVEAHVQPPGDHAVEPGLREPGRIGADPMDGVDDVLPKLAVGVVASRDRAR